MSRTADFHAALADRLPQLLYELLGKPSGKSGTEWRYRRKGSLAVRVDGAKAGQWFDHEAGRGGGFVALVAQELGYDSDRARDWVTERTGITLAGAATPRTTARSQPRTVEPQQAELAAKACEEAQRILDSAAPAPPTHPYLQAKGIRPHDLLADADGRLVIGLRDIDGALHTVQRIDAQGNKRFLAGGAKADHFAVIGDWDDKTQHLLVCEGWATGASIHEAVGEPVIVTFDAGNLQRVSRVVRQRYPAIDITIVADNDDKPGRTDNPGVTAATQAARDNDARLAIPPIAGDANDLVQAMGQQALRDCIAAARWVAALEPTYPEPRHDVAEARAELAGQIAGFMDAAAAYHDHLLAEPDHTEGADATDAIPVPMLGLPVDVGLGKTSQVREQIITALEAGRLGGGKVVFAVPRHDLGEEQVEAFAVAGVDAVLWKGRTAADPTPDNPDQRMCLDPDAQADALAAELSVEQAVCRVKRDGKTFHCPHYEVCGYQRQKRLAKSAQVIICAHDSLFHAMPKVIGRPALLVIDEGFWQSGLRGTDSPVQITVDSLDPYDADLRCYDHKNAYDYHETQFLIEHRLKLWKVLERTREGPLRLADLRAARLTPAICRDAAKLERGRLRDPGILPGMSNEERARRLGAVMPRRRNAWTPPGRAAAMWSILAQALEAGHNAWGVQVGRMHTPNGTVRSLDLLWRSSIRTGWVEKVPVLHIDATMRQELVTPFVPGITVAPAVSAKTPHVCIRQVLGAPVSSKALVPGPHAKDRQHTTAANNLRALRTYLAARTRQMGGGTAPVLAIGQMRAVSALTTGDLPANLETAHFNALSGLDRWGNVAGMVVLGRTLPAPSVIAKLQIALTGTPPKEDTDHESWWYPLTPRVIRRPKGRSHSTQGEYHPDPIAEAIRWSICEAELIQALGRGRGVNRTAGNPLQIDLLTDIVLPVTADEVISWDDLAPSRIDMMAARGVILDNAADRARCFPDLWPNHDAARKDGQRTGTNCYYRSSYNSRMSHSSAVATYRPVGAGQKPRTATFDLDLIPDPRSWLVEHLGELASCEVVTDRELAA